MIRLNYFLAIAVALLHLSLEMKSREAYAQSRTLHAELTHLRSGGQREWTSFPEKAYGNKLLIKFNAETNTTPVTIGLRRTDVKEGWRVMLNETSIANLFSDENDMNEAWELPVGALKKGENILAIEATGEAVDDVLIGQIWLDMRPRHAILNESRIRLSANDEKGNRTPCRFTILDSQGSLALFEPTVSDTVAFRSGVIYSSTGEADIGLRSGSYQVLCSRGFEYNLAQSSVSLSKEEQAAESYVLKRVVDTQGWVACDTHVHTFEISRHGDSFLLERMVTLAGEGIEIAVAADHNTTVDYRPHLQRLQLANQITPIVASEVTTKAGHFNVFPLTLNGAFPDYQTNSWDDLFKSIDKATPKGRVVVLNHPRDKHSGFVPFGPENMIDAVGERMDGRRLQVNAIELVNSAALQSDPMVVFHDWLTQINRGLTITAVGASDSHEVSRKIVGQGRTYVKVEDNQPDSIDVEKVIDDIIAGRALVSLGLLVELTVNQNGIAGQTVMPVGDNIDIHIRVQGPEWVKANSIELFLNGELSQKLLLTAEESGRAGTKKEVNLNLKVPPQDVHVVAVARGPGITSLHWPIAKPYQPSSPVWESYVFGASGIVRIDCDRDGEWTASLDYARKSVEASNDDFNRLLNTLKSFDTPTAAFAAQLWSNKHGSLRDPLITKQLKNASGSIQTGFERFIAAQRASLEAIHLPHSSLPQDRK